MNLKERIKIEITLLTIKFGEVEYYKESGLILIKNYKIPKGWNRASTDVLLTIPTGYPTAPPYAFKVSSGLRLDPDRMPSNSSEGQTALEKQWGHFSISPVEWKPTDDVASGNTLLTFIIGIVTLLQECNRHKQGRLS